LRRRKEDLKELLAVTAEDRDEACPSIPAPASVYAENLVRH
jgi:hypothetical protein